MTLATLSQVLQPALRDGYAVAGLVTPRMGGYACLCRRRRSRGLPCDPAKPDRPAANIPLPVLAAMFRHLAENASVPVVAHLDHGYTAHDCRLAIDSGFTSVMYDGSRKSLAQNIDETAAIAEMAHAAGVSCEGEIGFVGYTDGEGSAGTDPDESRAIRQPDRRGRNCHLG